LSHQANEPRHRVPFSRLQDVYLVVAHMSEVLDRAIAMVADGADVDWERLLEAAGSSKERLLLEDLRALARLAAEGEPAISKSPLTTIGISPPDGEQTSERWQHLELLEQIGRGGHGVVYRAWDTRLAREVALKLLVDDLSGDTIAEARRLARVSHPGVVSIYGAERVNGQVGLWMELLRGRTLDRILRDQGPFSVREAIGITLDICGAVAALHALGIVHRDIKAQNVVREHGGRIVLMDVGASLDLAPDDAGVNSLTGTPLYMAPELFEGGRASEASDVYAIGVLAYQLVTGGFPIDAHTIGDVRRAHVENGLRPLRQARPDLPQPFIAIVERCLAREPRDRFPSVASLERGLHEISGADAKKNGLSWVIVASMLVVAAVAGGAVTWTLATRSLDRPAGSASTSLTVSDEQYRVYTAYEELAFDKRLDDPAASSAATRGALNLIRQTLSGNHPVFTLLYARLADSARRRGDLQQADGEIRDAATHTYLSAGADHPYSTIVAMERARSAMASGDAPGAASELLKALAIRSRVLGLGELGQRGLPFTQDALERALTDTSLDDDSDGDGLLDVFERAAGLNPASENGASDGIFDDGRDHDGDGVANGLAFGSIGSPFLAWAHYGRTPPRSLMWRSPPQFPMVEGPEPGHASPPAWSISAGQSQAYYVQRLSAAQSARALERGFSLLIRLKPVRAWATVTADTAPVGPRFDLAIRRLADSRLEVRLLSSVVPLEGIARVLNAPVEGRWPLIELRYRPQPKAATLLVDGRRLFDGYLGHHQFQDPPEGGMSWGVSSLGDEEVHPSAEFNLVWLEIF
jgi:serine/threonine protein kinase